MASVISAELLHLRRHRPNVATRADPSGTVADPDINEGAAGGGKFWDIAAGPRSRATGSTTTATPGLWPDTDNAGFNISDNYIAHNWAEGIIYEISYNARITNNTFVDNAWGGGPSPALGGFPDAALYISESGSNSQVPGAYGTGFAVTGNAFTDNWGGVVIYENSNRACGISNDSLCTLVAPNIYTLASLCGPHPRWPAPARVPDYVDNCRWKSQNITVAYNTFNVQRRGTSGRTAPWPTPVATTGCSARPGPLRQVSTTEHGRIEPPTRMRGTRSRTTSAIARRTSSQTISIAPAPPSRGDSSDSPRATP